MTGCTNLRLGTFDMKLVQDFPVLEEVSPTANPESFQFNTGSDLKMPNNTYLVGLAKVNNRGQVAPVASVCNVPAVLERDHTVSIVADG